MRRHPLKQHSISTLSREIGMLPHSERRVRRKLAAGSPSSDDDEVVDDVATAASQLSANVLAMIFGFLPLNDVMRLRRVCRDWKDAAKGTFITSAYEVQTVHDFTAIEMVAIPHLQHLSLGHLKSEKVRRHHNRNHHMRYVGPGSGPGRGSRGERGGHRYSNGDNPLEGLAAETSNWYYTMHDIGIISNFQYLRSLSIIESPLNGEYPVFFNFPLLQKLSINDDPELHNYIKWDLKMLEGLPMLKELVCCTNEAMSGDINSLRVLKDTLETIDVANCRKVVGNFMVLKDFPRLRKLDLRGTAVAGDIRDIGSNDFKVLKELYLPRTVYGGSRYAFGSIAEVTEFMNRIHPLAHRFAVSSSWKLSYESPDWYADPNQVQEEELRDDHEIPPPFVCELLTLGGTRMGWRWRCNFPSRDRMYFLENGEIYDEYNDGRVFETCEINWLEPEPDRESDDYVKYEIQLTPLQLELSFFRGYHNPPTRDEFNRLRNEYLEYLQSEGILDRDIGGSDSDDDFAYYDHERGDY